MAGVETVDVSLTTGIADVRLKRGNDVSLSRLARLVKDNGFTPKEATITATGIVAHAEGTLAFRMHRAKETILIARERSRLETFRALQQQVMSTGSLSVELTGTVQFTESGSMAMALQEFTVVPSLN